MSTIVVIGWSTTKSSIPTLWVCISFQIKEPEPFAIESTISDGCLLTAKYKRDSIKLEVAFNSLDFDDPSTGMTFLSDYLIALVFLWYSLCDRQKNLVSRHFPLRMSFWHPWGDNDVTKTGSGEQARATGKWKMGPNPVLEMYLLMRLGFKWNFVPFFHFPVPRACSPLPDETVTKRSNGYHVMTEITYLVAFTNPARSTKNTKILQITFKFMLWS